ncbi:MAG TPA: rod shape-determining protein MreD [Sedimentisphaerales bacterium]|nr:rod shape-determining protein MreD [Sedimentisphaerales bacterium]HQG48397.1 rod shape-determining protein MreD [Sedimentisphaerales bacterium]HQI28096.1 rod shape-determining protein MreD [Sedimentisphaerales bacterium]
MRWIRFAVLVLAASILQASLMDVLRVRRDVKPDLLLVLLVFFGSRCTPTDGVITSFVLGFVADLINPIGGVMGPRIISFGLFGTLLSDVQNVFSLRRPLYQSVAIFLLGVLTAVLGYLLASLRTEGSQTRLLTLFLWQPLYSGILGPLFSLPVGWWMRMNRKNRSLYGHGSRFR